MKLPSPLSDMNEWLIVGPMGPAVPNSLGDLPIMAIDGGAKFCNKMDAWVGDGDSYKTKVDCKNIYQYSSNKDLSDFALGLSLLNFSPKQIHIWGMIGGRTDHELINYGEALHYLDSATGTELIFYNQQGDIHGRCFSRGSREVEIKGVFSIIGVKLIKIQLTGECLYQLKEETDLLPLSSLGLSNVGQGLVTIKNEGAVMILFSGSP